MAEIINKKTTKLFTLNNIPYPKIYQPLAQGSEAIGIYSIYDTRNQLLSSTSFREFTIEGKTYENQIDTIEAILNVVYGEDDKQAAFDDVEFTQNVPFSAAITNMKLHKLTSDVILQPEKDGAIEGAETIVKIIGSGANSVNLAAFKKFEGTLYDNLDLSLNSVNVIVFKLMNGVYYYSIIDQYFDNTQPIAIKGKSLGFENNYLLIEFTQGCYANSDGTGGVQASDLNLTFVKNGGTATNCVITSLTDENGNALIGGETKIKVLIDVTGTPNGQETININVVANSIYNRIGVVTPDTEMTGNVNLNDKQTDVILQLNPEGYFKFDEAAGMGLEVDKIDTLADSSNNENNLTSVAPYRPTWMPNDDRTIFKTSTYMTAGDNMKLQAQTMFAVFEPTALNTELRIMGVNTTGGRQYDNVYMVVDTSGVLHFSGGNGINYAFDLSFNLPNLKRLVIVGVYDPVAGEAFLRINGNVVAEDLNALTSVNNPPSEYHWLMGAYNGADGGAQPLPYADFYMYKCGVFARALSVQDLGALESRLIAEYPIPQ